MEHIELRRNIITKLQEFAIENKGTQKCSEDIQTVLMDLYSREIAIYSKIAKLNESEMRLLIGKDLQFIVSQIYRYYFDSMDIEGKVPYVKIVIQERENYEKEK